MNKPIDLADYTYPDPAANRTIPVPEYSDTEGPMEPVKISSMVIQRTDNAARNIAPLDTSAVVVNVQNVVIQDTDNAPRNTVLLDRPTSLVCPKCNTSIETNVTHNPGFLTWLIAGFLCILGCWLCVIIPFCVTPWLDVAHSCPNCKAHLGYYTRM